MPLSSWFGLRAYLADQGRSQAEVPRISFVTKEDPRWRPLYPFHKKNFAPRLGLAWSPGFNDGLGKFLFGGAGKTSVRAGWGMFYDSFGQGILRRFDATAFGLSNTLTNRSAALSATSAPRFTSFTEIPNGVLEPAPPTVFPATYPDIFAITNSVDDSLVPPYSMTMNFNIGRDFGDGIFVQAGYAGRLGRRLMSQTDMAAATNLKDAQSGQTYFQAATALARLGLAGTDIEDVKPLPFFENNFPGLAEPGLSATQGAYDYISGVAPDYTYALFLLDPVFGTSKFGPNAMFNSQYSFLSAWRNMGSSDYHSFQLNARKNWDNGDLIDFNYTFSKSIDLTSSAERVGYSTGVIANPWEPGLSRAVSDFDTTHQFAASAVYSLPFGSGRRYMTNANGLMNALFGGWQLSTVWRAPLRGSRPHRATAPIGQRTGSLAGMRVWWEGSRLQVARTMLRQPWNPAIRRAARISLPTRKRAWRRLTLNCRAVWVLATSCAEKVCSSGTPTSRRASPCPGTRTTGCSSAGRPTTS